MRRGPCPEPNFKDWQGVTGADILGNFSEDFGFMKKQENAIFGQLVQGGNINDTPLITAAALAELESQQFTFNFGDTPIRSIITPEGEPLFCLADVCKGAGLNRTDNVATQIKAEFGIPLLNRGIIQRPETGPIEATFITEAQLYFVAMRGRSQVAHEFRQWICNEVIPQLRKHGSYHLRAPLPELPQRDLSGHYNVSYVTIANAMADALGLDDHGKMIFSWIIERAKSQGYAIAQETRRPAAPQLAYNPAQLDLIAMERAKSLCAVQMANERAELQSTKDTLDEVQKQLAQAQNDLEQTEHEKEALEQALEQLQRENEELSEGYAEIADNSHEEELKKRCTVLERLAFLLLSVPDSEDAKKLAKAILG